MAKHARFSPSSLAYREVCPSFSSRPGTNAAADEGTKLHECVEKGSTEGLTDAQASCVFFCLQHRDAILASMQSPQVFHEIKLEIADGLTHGTADFLAVDGDHAALADWKMGRHRVTAPEDNAQVAAYTLGVFERFPQVNTVEASICQPRQGYIGKHTFTREGDFANLDLRIRTIIARASMRGGKRPCIPFEGCKYCRKQATCPGLINKVLPLARKCAGISIPDVVQNSDTPTPGLITRMLDVAAIVQPWCDAVRNTATEMALSGHDIPGYHLGYVTAAGYVAQPAAIFDALPHSETSAPDEGTWTGGDLPGITAEDFITACTAVDIGKLEDFFVARAKHGFKGSMKTALSCWLTERNLVRPGERKEAIRKNY